MNFQSRNKSRRHYTIIKMPNKVFVTTSWDDGSKYDLKLAELLRKYKLPATFYISKDYREDRLSEEEIKNLAKDFEIGAHTLTHPNLDLVTKEKAELEIKGSKEWLERIIADDVNMFAYPRGKFNAVTKHIVENAGFIGGRTIEEFKYGISFDPLEMPTSLRIAPYPWRKKTRGELSFSGGLFGFQPRRYAKSLALMLKPSSYLSFTNLAKGFFDKVLASDGIFHIWSHSWEIEKLNMWDELEGVFKHIAGRNDVEYASNGRLMKLLKF